MTGRTDLQDLLEDLVLDFHDIVAAGGAPALREAHRFFGKNSPLSVARLAVRLLRREHISALIGGGLALVTNGCYWCTCNVELIVSPEQLEQASNIVRAMRERHRIQNGVIFRTAGSTPNPKTPAIRYPEPSSKAIQARCLRFLCLHDCVQIHLALAMHRPQILRHAATMLEVLGYLKLPRNYRVHEQVRCEYQRLWDLWQDAQEPSWRECLQ